MGGRGTTMRAAGAAAGPSAGFFGPIRSTTRRLTVFFYPSVRCYRALLASVLLLTASRRLLITTQGVVPQGVLDDAGERGPSVDTTSQTTSADPPRLVRRRVTQTDDEASEVRALIRC